MVRANGNANNNAAAQAAATAQAAFDAAMVNMNAMQNQMQQVMNTMQALQQQNTTLQAQNAAVQTQVANLQEVRQQNDELRARMDELAQQQQARERGPVVQPGPPFQPFSEAMSALPIPEALNSLKLESYDGPGDPMEPLASFNTRMLVLRVEEPLKCKLFPTTLKKTANAWFGSMPPRSITNFSDFAYRFVAQFSAKRAEKVTKSVLFETRQRPGESIDQFLYRFTELTLQATDVR